MTIDPRDFGRLEGKVDELLDMMKAGDARHSSLEERVRNGERAIAHAQGRQSVISVIAAAVVSIVVGFVGHKLN